VINHINNIKALTLTERDEIRMEQLARFPTWDEINLGEIIK
jgi:hypothetical protein